MLRHAAYAVPWLRISLAAGLVVVLMELVRWNAWVLWPLEGIAVGLLAGAAAWCFDEPAAAVVDTLPRGPAWRAGARTPAIVVLLAAWTTTVFHAGNGPLFGHRNAVVLHGISAVAVGAALAIRARGRGAPTPGLRIAMVVVPVTTAVALIRPLARAVPVFPYGTSSLFTWNVSTNGWFLVAVVALAVVAGELGESHRWSRPGRQLGSSVRRRPSSPA